MKKNRISDSIGYLDGDLVSEAVTYKRNTARRQILRWGSLAACLMVVVMAAVLILPALSVGGDTVSLGGIERNYKNGIKASELAYIYPWEYRTVSEKFTEIRFNGVVYRTRGIAIREELLEDVLGECTAQGYDIYADETITDTFTARKINGASDDFMVAVGMEGVYYVYLKHEPEAPATLGELFDIYGLDSNLHLERFSVYEKGKNKGYFLMEGGADIMALLSEYRGAPAWAEADAQSMIRGDYICFTATSESLGSYKKVFSVTADGYISTNVFEYHYVYYIGEEAANKIIAYAKANSEETASEPYEYILAGTLTEIGDGYLLIDDSILCKDSADGLVFRVPTDDIRIRRSVELEHIKAGDVVAVHFRGTIDPETLTVSGAQGIDAGVIIDGNIAIPE